MKFLCLAYGPEDGLGSLTEEEKEKAFARDEVIRSQGHLMSAVKPEVTTVRNWTGEPDVTDGPGTIDALLLAGFSVIEAVSVQDVVNLVSGTPCARAKGYIEIRPLWNFETSDA